VSLPRPIRDHSLVCYVTDRRQLPVPVGAQETDLLEKIAAAASAGVDWIQIREKDLSGVQVGALARHALMGATRDCRIIVNDRLDVACAVGADGVHLGERSISIREAGRFVRERGMKKSFLIGASVHSLDTARKAEMEGADYLIFGPVFATPAKVAYGAPQGLERLAETCGEISIPVLAIGGITPENARDCYKQGAAGVAGIRIFQASADLQPLINSLRGI
jgi:thiamine-phosphate pyrophosphorylase